MQNDVIFHRLLVDLAGPIGPFISFEEKDRWTQEFVVAHSRDLLGFLRKCLVAESWPYEIPKESQEHWNAVVGDLLERLARLIPDETFQTVADLVQRKRTRILGLGVLEEFTCDQVRAVADVLCKDLCWTTMKSSNVHSRYIEVVDPTAMICCSAFDRAITYRIPRGQQSING